MPLGIVKRKVGVFFSEILPPSPYYLRLLCALPFSLPHLKIRAPRYPVSKTPSFPRSSDYALSALDAVLSFRLSSDLPHPLLLPPLSLSIAITLPSSDSKPTASCLLHPARYKLTRLVHPCGTLTQRLQGQGDSLGETLSEDWENKRVERLPGQNEWGSLPTLPVEKKGRDGR